MKDKKVIKINSDELYTLFEGPFEVYDVNTNETIKIVRNWLEAIKYIYPDDMSLWKDNISYRKITSKTAKLLFK